MLYLNQSDIKEIELDWQQIIDVVHHAARLIFNQDFVQPVKPYLRFNDLTNRIIAMPAYLGGEVNTAGLKWIASFPKNINKSLPRAHSVTVLNDAGTGKPFCIINTNLISSIRTAGVSGLMVREYLKWINCKRPLIVGIVGYGPIGKTHLEMLTSTFNEYVDKVYIYDLQPVDEKKICSSIINKVQICDSWEEAYENSDIFITATASAKTYIDKTPKKGSLQLNVSLRDYRPECREYMDVIIVDDWDEVCRENTDIEVMHKTMGLRREDTLSLAKALFTDEASRRVSGEETVMFNPMGMAVFDIAVGYYYSHLADVMHVGTRLEG